MCFAKDIHARKNWNKCFYNSGINPLNSDKLEEYLKANLTVIAMWSNKECMSCDVEIFSMYKMIYTYQDHEDVKMESSFNSRWL